MRLRRTQWVVWLDRRPEWLSVIGLLLVTLVMSVCSDQFFALSNLGNIARQVSINAIIAAGMTVVIIIGGIDLSVGAVMSLSMTLAAGAMLAGVPVGLASALGIAAGAAFGAVNGALIAYLRLPAIIVTLATMEIPRGIALLYTEGYPKSGLPESFAVLGRGEFLHLPVPAFVVAAVFVSAHLLLTRFSAGRYFYALGGNEEAVRFSGVDVRIYKLLAYSLSGLTAGIAGIVLASRLMSGQPNAGVGFELDAIAAVVLGGAAITGGRGSIMGTLIGVLMLGMLNNGLNLMNISPYTQKILKGLIVLIAVFAGRNRSKV
jgi:ribose transport system permease protein